MRFLKGHGTENDFVVLPDEDGALELTPELVQALCDRRAGLGGDGVLRVVRSAHVPDADPATEWFMDYRNADGSIAEMCGNGVRCVAKYVVDRDIVDGDVVRVDTRAGVKEVEVLRDEAGRFAAARVDMGAPVIGKVDWPMEIDGETISITTLSMGNPHAVMVVDDLDGADLAALGRRLQTHPDFPDGVNVEVISVPDRETVRGRIFERGVGETMASGTGASAMAAAAHLLGLAARRTTVVLPGGELRIDWTESTLWVTGPAAEVASGELDEAWLTTSF